MADTVNPLELILQAAGGEAVEAVVISSMNSNLREMLGASEIVELPEDLRGAILSWEGAKPYLDYEVDQYSVNEHDPVMVWTASWVIQLGFDDGPVRATRVPRNPKGEPFEW